MIERCCQTPHRGREGVRIADATNHGRHSLLRVLSKGPVDFWIRHGAHPFLLNVANHADDFESGAWHVRAAVFDDVPDGGFLGEPLPRNCFVDHRHQWRTRAIRAGKSAAFAQWDFHGLKISGTCDVEQRERHVFFRWNGSSQHRIPPIAAVALRWRTVNGAHFIGSRNCAKPIE